MAPNKDWIELFDDRLSDAYLQGIQTFLDYAFQKAGERYEIRCPCVKCGNTYSKSREVVEIHLKVHGMLRNYTFWYHHGERLGETDFETPSDASNDSGDDTDDEAREILEDFFPHFAESTETTESIEEEPNDEAKKFYRLLNDSQQPIYKGSKFSKLSILVRLLHIKSVGKWSNESFSMLLKLLNEDLLPESSTLPNSYYDSKKIIKDLGLSYTKIDVCEKNCMLYWKGDLEAEFCKVCGASRWENDNRNGECKYKANGKKVPKKTLRYFPLQPRLKRLFMSRKTSSLMRWHHYKIKNDDDGRTMTHPSDSRAWKHFDELHKSFSSNPCNVRLGLATDGFQPFANSKKSYSIWPVIIVPYNLPPWMCMDQSNFILSMLIPGPEGPGDAIDVYLLNGLWIHQF